jgi:DNA-binding NtrC family response regulator
MPYVDGMAIVRKVRAETPETEVIVLTAHGSVESAVEAMKLGAFDYLRKPIAGPDELRLLAARALEHRRLIDATERVVDRGALPPLGHGDPAMTPVITAIDKVARTSASVLLLGETGTGKELFAHLIHVNGPRRAKPFVAQSCGALPDTLLESELFGHERGAFTGAVGERKGLFEEADEGTIFLDEVGETSPAMQLRLLRVLQEGEVRRVGATATRRVDVRVIAATNADLDADVAAGRFRRDLYYRLNVFPVRLPPLRERAEDIPALADHFLRDACRRARRAVPAVAPDALALLRGYPWPGNVRELENEVERAVALADDGHPLRATHLSERIAAGSGLPPSVQTLNDAVEALKCQMIEDALRECGSKTRAAERLGLTRQSLQQMLRRRQT